MSDKDFAYLKAKLYSIIYRNVFLKKEKPKTKSIVVQIVSGDSKSSDAPEGLVFIVR